MLFTNGTSCPSHYTTLSVSQIYARDLIDEVLKEVVEFDTSYQKPLHERLLQFLVVDTAMRVDHPVAQEFIENVAKNTTR